MPKKPVVCTLKLNSLRVFLQTRCPWSCLEHRIKAQEKGFIGGRA